MESNSEPLISMLLSRSKVMVHPSYMDTFAIVVLEALSVDTPVVAYGIPAIKLIIRLML